MVKIYLSYTYYIAVVPTSAYHVNQVIQNFISKNLTEYDRSTNEVLYTYAIVEQKDNYFLYRLPRQSFWLLKKYLFGSNIEFTIDTCFIKKDNIANIAPHISLRKRIHPKDHQKPYINFLLNHKNSMRLLDSQPGSGKTFSVTYAIMQLRKKALIIVPAFLIEQWYKRLREYTTIKQQDIYPIVGSKSLYELNYRISAKEPMPESIFLCSITTLHNYIKDNNQQFLPLDKLLLHLNCGIKVHDEVHMNFYQNVLLDLYTTIPINCYLTATPGRSVYRSNKIFKFIYPSYIQLHASKYNTKVKIYSVYYKFQWDKRLPEKYFVIEDIGYSQIRYEKYILRRFGLLQQLDSILLKCIKKFYLNDGNPKGKLLIFAGTKRLISHIVQFLQQTEEISRYQLRVGQFTAEDPESVLSINDIIVTTVGSSGVGKDISNISCVICLISIKSPILTKQIIGRIRESDIESTNFIFLVNKELKVHRNHDKIRQRYIPTTKIEL